MTAVMLVVCRCKLKRVGGNVLACIKPGIYQHYKGGLYQVYELARHSETDEMLVVYRPLYGERALWVRPLELFIEKVEVSEGERARLVPRFLWQREADAEVDK